MAYIYRKEAGGKSYYYLRASKRAGKRIIAKDIAYLGSSIEQVKNAVEKLPAKQVRAAYKTINRFIETNRWLEKAKELKIGHSPFIEQDILEQVEASRLHWQEVFQKRDELTKRDFLKQFAIDFSFNTTSIEGNTITLKEAAMLLTENLTPKNKTLREVYDVQNTEKCILTISEKPPIMSHDAIISIHKELMENIDLRIGYRTGDVRVVHSHFDSTPAQYVKTDMGLLLKWHEENKGKLHPIALGSIFHHKFEKIHPFFDGNGRTGRMCLNAIMFSAGYPPIIIRKKNRNAYLDALGEADKSDLTKAEPRHYKALVEFAASEMISSYWNDFL